MRNLALTAAILISLLAVPAFADTAEENMNEAAEGIDNAAERTGEAMDEAAADMRAGAEIAADDTAEAADEAAENMDEAADEAAANMDEAADEAAANINEAAEETEEKSGCSSTGAGFGGTLAGALLIGLAAARRREV